MLPYASLSSKQIVPTGAVTIVEVGEGGAMIVTPSIANGDGYSSVVVQYVMATGQLFEVSRSIYDAGA